jgi:mannose-6-phosphate isomerase-like protein (cupin superfamily)
MNDHMDEVEIIHHFGGGVYAKQTVFRPGLILSQHKHRHEHLSLLTHGTVLVSVDGLVSKHTATGLGPVVLTIPAGKHHKVESLTAVVWFCIHATDETDPEKVDHELIKEN